MATKIGTKKRVRVRTYAISSTGIETATSPDALTVLTGVRFDGTLILETSDTWPASGAIVEDAEGDFHFDYTTTHEGTVEIRAEATGVIVVAEQTSFPVAKRNL